MLGFVLLSDLGETNRAGLSEDILSASISKASRADLQEILDLLAAVVPPQEGVAEHLDGFLRFD